MNAVQSFTVCYSCDDDAEPQASAAQCHHKFFTVHTPMVVLGKADQETLFAEFTSRLLVRLGVVGQRFQNFGTAAAMTKDVPIQLTTLCFDSLVTNVATLKKLRIEVHKKHENDGHHQIFPVLAVKCLVHQLSLSRKCLLFGFESFWSSVVRLAHLMEVSSFRTPFRRAMLAVISQHFQYVPVAELPPSCQQRRERRNQLIGLIADKSSRHNKKRLDLHLALARFDNGCPDSEKFCHYCCGTGDCCTGGNHRAKSRFALIQMAKYYTLLFSYGYPVPLAYRWVHAARALQFIKDFWTKPWKPLF